MNRPLALRKSADWHFYQLLDWPMAARTPWCLLVVTLMMVGATYVVYQTGGTAYAYPYLILIPVLFAAAWFGLAGGLLSALIAAALMAAMPLDVERGVAQTPLNWMLRMALYLVIGGTAGWLFQALRRAFRERERVVRSDPRSGLPNQVALEQDLQRWLIHSYIRREPLSLLLVRVADINDLLEAMGADASDELAGYLGRRLNHIVAPKGAVYRFSLSELAIPLRGCDDVQLASTVQAIVEAGEENFRVRDVPVRVQLALGACTTDTRLPPPSPGQCRERLDGLLSEARLALFSALEQRISYCRFEPSLKQKNQDNIRLIAQVRQGLDRREFELHYQPKIRVADGTIVGCEGLIRWRDGSGQLIPPGQFMPKVENTTLIAPVTEFVSRQGCEFIRLSQCATSINFSARNLVDDQLLQYLERLVQQCGVDPAVMEIEVTESALIQNLGAARQAIERLRHVGFKVSIDDFGTGFASFDYLRQLPITGIKIDRAFVRDLEESEKARRLLACMIEMGHALELVVTAEGVETAGQYRILQSLKCDQAQGFYFTRPLSARAFMKWCEHYRVRFTSPE